jgi:hypothetical protein
MLMIIIFHFNDEITVILIGCKFNNFLVRELVVGGKARSDVPQSACYCRNRIMNLEMRLLSSLNPNIF